MERIFNHIWEVPLGALSFRIDALSMVFLMIIGTLVLCAALYSIGYMKPYRGNKPLWSHAILFVWFVLALLLVVAANNVILFLAAWEGMTLTAFFLIIFDHEKSFVRKAAGIYFIASHCATFFLFVMFFIMASVSGSTNFTDMASTVFTPWTSVSIFLLALVGFGVKAGFLPFHIWLPYAHPAAPSHVSSLLSGVAIKMGIYGVCRVLSIIGVLPVWCGYVMLLIGIISGVMGVLYALGQHELKKLLAYHSVENIGIIAMGLGLGMLGNSYHQPFLAVLGFGGALLHVVNHALFKGLLFLGAGAVIHKMHCGEMDRLGGLAKIMPVTSVLFMIGALSICGLPLFNGFISEFLIYFGLFQGTFSLTLLGIISCVVAILALALMGALALACFCKVYGTIFLGVPRELSDAKEGFSGQACGGGDVAPIMLAPMILLAGICIWIGLCPVPMVRFSLSAATVLSQIDLSMIDLQRILTPLTMIIGILFIFIILVAGLAFMRKSLLGSAPVPLRETWGCAFSRISSRCQYTSSSFALSIVNFARGILLFQKKGGQIREFFPNEEHLSSSVHDACEERFFLPILSGLTRISRQMEKLGIRYTQIYLMYILLFLIFLLAWKFR